MTCHDVLAFWFDELSPTQWFASDAAVDASMRQRFLPLMQQAANAELHAWRETPPGRLAEVLLLDQFSRNVYRDTPAAFAQDPMALVLAQEAVRAGALAALSAQACSFALMPYMHSESWAIHAIAEPLYRTHALPENHGYELEHKAIIDRFGRYPHRNAVLGRISTAAELAFLQQPGSSF